jgi:hypothetical protein
VADWTVILSTVGAATVAGGLTGGFGYLGIRRSMEVTKKQMSEETARSHEQIVAENERLRAQHREDHLRNRQGTYHALMDADDEMVRVLREGTGDVKGALSRLGHLVNGAVLFGTESVEHASTVVHVQYLEVVQEAEKRAGGKGSMSPDDIRAIFQERGERIVAARTALIEAMREDVGP